MNEFILLQEGIWLYITVFLCLIGGAVGLPIPEDIPLFAAGVMVQLGHARFDIVLAVAYTGILLGDAIIYAIGRKLGPSLFRRPWFQKRVRPGRIRLLRRQLSRKSLITILLARHLFYLRTITFLTCGAVKMPAARFFAADALAALISAPLIISLGYFLAENRETVLNNLNLIAIGAGLLLLMYFLTKFYYGPSKRNEPDRDVSYPDPSAEEFGDERLGEDFGSEIQEESNLQINSNGQHRR